MNCWDDSGIPPGYTKPTKFKFQQNKNKIEFCYKYTEKNRRK